MTKSRDIQMGIAYFGSADLRNSTCLSAGPLEVGIPSPAAVPRFAFGAFGFGDTKLKWLMRVKVTFFAAGTPLAMGLTQAIRCVCTRCKQAHVSFGEEQFREMDSSLCLSTWNIYSGSKLCQSFKQLPVFKRREGRDT